MNETEKNKIKRFLDDDVTQKAVYNTLLRTFLKPRDRGDVQMLAASRIAIDLLEEGWKELHKVSHQVNKEPREVKQVGL
jgi:protein involved in sex pheromone biosynthesis